MTTHVIRNALGWMLLLGSVVAACGNPPCNTLAGSGGIILRVVDATTSTKLDSLAVVSVDRLTPPPESRTSPVLDPSNSNALLITEREGVYRLTVSVPGYQSWQREVSVPSASEACRDGAPLAVSVEARLVRS